jgi:hypothetical protein
MMVAAALIQKGTSFAPPALANTISSLLFSRFICAKRRSRWPDSIHPLVRRLHFLRCRLLRQPSSDLRRSRSWEYAQN